MCVCVCSVCCTCMWSYIHVKLIVSLSLSLSFPHSTHSFSPCPSVLLRLSFPFPLSASLSLFARGVPRYQWPEPRAPRLSAPLCAPLRPFRTPLSAFTPPSIPLHHRHPPLFRHAPSLVLLSRPPTPATITDHCPFFRPPPSSPLVGPAPIAPVCSRLLVSTRTRTRCATCS